MADGRTLSQISGHGGRAVAPGSPALRARADQPRLVGDHHELGAIAGAQLGHRPVDMRLDRERADLQPGGDLVVGQPAPDLDQDLALADGEGVQP
ncbi:hypothetical protein GCM10017744_071230 [Streptomyces antimycoticus]